MIAFDWERQLGERKRGKGVKERVVLKESGSMRQMTGTDCVSTVAERRSNKKRNMLKRWKGIWKSYTNVFKLRNVHVSCSVEKISALIREASSAPPFFA